MKGSLTNSTFSASNEIFLCPPPTLAFINSAADVFPHLFHRALAVLHDLHPTNANVRLQNSLSAFLSEAFCQLPFLTSSFSPVLVIRILNCPVGDVVDREPCLDLARISKDYKTSHAEKTIHLFLEENCDIV